MARFLIVVERAYTGFVEEQYSTMPWICWSHQRMGGQVHVLLRSLAVLYALPDQPSSSLTIGGVVVCNTHSYAEDLRRLLAEGGAVSVIREDLRRLRIDAAALLPGVTLVERANLARLCLEHDGVWYW